jgi:hypothetical protein
MLAQFGSLLQDGAMLDPDLWGALRNQWNGERRAVALLCVLEVALDCARRVILPLDLFPLRLGWLVRRGPDEACKERQSVALSMINGDMPSLPAHGVDGLSAKFAVCFRQELQEAAASGRMNAQVHELVCSIFGALLPTTQEVESMNSQVRRMVLLSPSMALPLLSSRRGLCGLLAVDRLVSCGARSFLASVTGERRRGELGGGTHDHDACIVGPARRGSCPSRQGPPGRLSLGSSSLVLASSAFSLGPGRLSSGLCIKKTMATMASRHCAAEEFLAECEACHVETTALGNAFRFDVPVETPSMVAAAEVASRALAGRRPEQAVLDAASLILRVQKAWRRALEPSTRYAVGLLEAGQVLCCWAAGSAALRGRSVRQGARDLTDKLADARGILGRASHHPSPTLPLGTVGRPRAGGGRGSGNCQIVQRGRAV